MLDELDDRNGVETIIGKWQRPGIDAPEPLARRAIVSRRVINLGLGDVHTNRVDAIADRADESTGATGNVKQTRALLLDAVRLQQVTNVLKLQPVPFALCALLLLVNPIVITRFDCRIIEVSRRGHY